MIEKWIWAPPSDLMMVVLSAVVIYVAVIVATRLTGLRSFAQFSSFDFAMSIAIGSLISISLLSPEPPMTNALAGITAIFTLHKLAAILRRIPRFGALLDNTPVLLIKDGELIHENLRKTAVNEDDLRSILRQNNVCDRSTVRAAILETAGRVSVLHTEDGEDREMNADAWIFEDVIGIGEFE